MCQNRRTANTFLHLLETTFFIRNTWGWLIILKCWVWYVASFHFPHKHISKDTTIISFHIKLWFHKSEYQWIERQMMNRSYKRIPPDEMVPVPLSRHSTQYKYRLQPVIHVQLFVKQVTDRKSQARFELKDSWGSLVCVEQKLCLHEKHHASTNRPDEW